MFSTTAENLCKTRICLVFLGYGHQGMTKEERSEFEAHIVGCTLCQATARTKSETGDLVAQLLEARRRMA